MLNRIIAIFGVFSFFIGGTLFLYSSLNHGVLSLWALATGAFAGWLLSDVATGTLHWFGDRFFHEDTPIVGSLFVFPFREHHVLPKKMTEHDFFELCGTSGLLVAIFWVVVYFVRGPQGDFWSYFSLFFGLFGFLTNLFHKWAHMEKLPAFVRFLQKSGLILDPVTHDVHHQTYDKYYCVTHGHMNWILEKLQVFQTAEKLLFFLPRGEEEHEKPA
ncbi:MAG: fatty acid desaturase CarF family protein [Bdellovibrionota bacterium]